MRTAVHRTGDGGQQRRLAQPGRDVDGGGGGPGRGGEGHRLPPLGSRGALALDAFLAEFSRQQPIPDTGTFRGDLLATLRGWIRSVTRTPAGQMLAGLVAEVQGDPALAAAWRERVFEPLRASNKILVQRAIDRGEIPADTDATWCSTCCSARPTIACCRVTGR